jgi:misacylated tRNA(Ala) deacylase
MYWEDDHCFEVDAQVIAIEDNAIAFDRTCFYPGGGGQPSDEGTAIFRDGLALDIASVTPGKDGVLWHRLKSLPSHIAPGQSARLALNREKRVALSRYHTVLHIVNTLALRDHNAWITGAQIGVDYARIDFKWDGFSAAMCAGLEDRVNAVIEANHPLGAYYLAEDEFAKRPELLRTLEAKPPVIDGRVRVVAIEGFDAQACGGTHVGRTGELGRFSIYRTENKGKINKRLYVRLTEALL